VKITELSDKIEDGGCVIEANGNKSLADIDRNEIVKIFENKGIILFKNFNIAKDQIVKFTDLFTLQYANDANRREIRFENPKLHNVDPGKMEMPLHSEASYSPSWPEIVWFYCRLAPKKSGQTTVCDGRSIYKNLSQKTKNFFLSNQIVYKLKIPYERKKNNQSDIEEIKLKPWYIENPGVTDCFIDFKNKEIHLKQKRYAVVETRKSNKVSFSNHLQIILDRDPQVLGWSLEDGSKIPDDIMSEVKKVSDRLTVNINWNDNELCMIDNKRMMHGRRAISENEKRDILNIQSLRASFGYGSTTRK
tara:strand:- start:613 stop:1527 length:915 start_codon:yes stop_codon:yes gene_type:complete